MTEKKEPYAIGTFGTLWDHPPTPSPAAPPPDTVLAVLERIRDLADEELARIERHGGCAGFALRVRGEVAKVLR